MTLVCIDMPAHGLEAAGVAWDPVIVTPRGTDWSLALLVAAGVASGLATWFAGSPGAAWVFAAHAVAGAASRRSSWSSCGACSRAWRRRASRRSRWSSLVLGSGFVWASAGSTYLAGYSVLAWHAALGGALAAIVLTHALARAKRPRRRDLANRRQFLLAGAAGAGALGAWALQRPLQRALGLPGAERRFTGSYDAGSFTGNDFPTTSWVADDPAPGGRAASPSPAACGASSRWRRPQLDRGDELTATLDCTGGFSSRAALAGRAARRAARRGGRRAGRRATCA